MRTLVCSALALSLLLAADAGAAGWPPPRSPVVAEADGYIDIPGAAVQPRKEHVYKAVFNATAAADAPSHLMPALNMAGSELNAFAVAKVPSRNVKFVVVFHGDAIDGILDDAHYRAKFNTPNPNLKVLHEMKAAGVKLYVCGQNLAFANIDPKSIASDVTVASDALIVLMEYQNDGYALLSF
ncbi:MAG TPA: DsrE family protein [Thermoanaerobaculia bacterium]|jgi:intracellular sulfur oxidation DsrE/DsrF family protein